ncbi:DUF4140 domain-containing protein [Pelotalea chapellei]|uniref:DUF4140 domain-containing protein n=1 Tax=Pelotalea chapellei TaxID=44671 RepID=A0ABS5UA43_9BACT|nr:DUF4140 domain-containing protein [Pelotalea chapellei]MBT1072537.1 DUF4140 domain-containing protein [Pelotalea chapellei]
MKYLFCLCFLLTGLSAASAAEKKSVTFFSDGAFVEIESQATRGSLSLPLPPHVIDGSLRITPLNGAAIQRVEIEPTRQEKKYEKEFDTLIEQKNRLQDRLQALSTREEIFKSAAKSQSGKAPRKTKTNPDPMQSIRQGTDFAIAQLESVYTARRRTEHEIRRIDSRISAIRTRGTGADTFAKVTVHPENGRVRFSYLLTEPAWTPRYDLRLDGSDTAKLSLYGDLPQSFGGYTLKTAFGPLTMSATGPRLTPVGKFSKLADYQLSSSNVLIEDTARPSFSFTLTNTTPVHLPAGQATLYYRDEYRGQLSFEGLSSARSKRLVLHGENRTGR